MKMLEDKLMSLIPVPLAVLLIPRGLIEYFMERADVIVSPPVSRSFDVKRIEPIANSRSLIKRSEDPTAEVVTQHARNVPPSNSVLAVH